MHRARERAGRRPRGGASYSVATVNVALLHRRRARLAAKWADALDVGGRNSPLLFEHYSECEYLGKVVRVWPCRRGAKAWIRWVADDATTAAWFWGPGYPREGAYVSPEDSMGAVRRFLNRMFSMYGRLSLR